MNINGSTLDDSSNNDNNTSNLDSPFATQEVGKIRRQDQTCSINVIELMQTNNSPLLLTSDTTHTLNSIQKTLRCSSRMVKVFRVTLVTMFQSMADDLTHSPCKTAMLEDRS